MKTATRKLRGPTKWHGGKDRLARRIIARFPDHRQYVEPFLGGGSVLLNRPRSELEYGCDLNKDLIYMWRTLRDCGDEVSRFLREEVQYAQTWFDWASKPSPEGGDVVLAAKMIMRYRMSRGGMGKTFAWSDRERGGMPGDLNAWVTFLADELHLIVERIQDVGFILGDGIREIEGFGSGTLIYCDPPYPSLTRTARDVYRHEMDYDAHGRLLRAIKASHAKIFISGYRCDLYDDELSGWTRHEFDMPNNAGQGKTKQRRTECLWENP